MADQTWNRSNLLRKRMNIAFWSIFLGYLGLLGRLVYLQIAEGPRLHAQAQKLRQQKIVLRAHRGTVSDRDGKPLAVSLYAGTLGFDPSVVQVLQGEPKRAGKFRDSLAKSIHQVATILQIPEESLKQFVRESCAQYNPHKPVRFVTVQRDLSLHLASQIRDARPRIVGFGIEDSSQRFYSSGPNAAQVVGFLAPDGRGAAGLERSCDHYVDGQDGFAITEVDTLAREIPNTRKSLTAAADGLDVQTTLDSNAQQVAMEEATKIYTQYHPKGISVVMVSPDTGDILALVSLPTFDPNPGHRATFSTQALADRCTARLYEPGSTLKALTISAALDDGTISPESSFYCPGAIAVGKKVIHCAMHGQAGGHGTVTALTILRHSCNVGAAQVGMRMGAHRLFAADERFGLLDPLRIGLPAVARGRLSFDPNEQVYTNAKAARVAFGHSITTTPLHVAMAYAALANDGVLMKPRLLMSVTDNTGKVQKTWKPTVARRVVSSRTAAMVREMLCDVVTNGTGRVAAIPGYRIAGKTGTANKYHLGAYVGSFIGFLPASPNVKPRVVILVAVDEPQGKYYGAEVAAPAFRAIAQRLMDYWQVPKDDLAGAQARTAMASLGITNPDAQTVGTDRGIAKD